MTAPAPGPCLLPPAQAPKSRGGAWGWIEAARRPQCHPGGGGRKRDAPPPQTFQTCTAHCSGCPDAPAPAPFCPSCPWLQECATAGRPGCADGLICERHFATCWQWALGVLCANVWIGKWGDGGRGAVAHTSMLTAAMMSARATTSLTRLVTCDLASERPQSSLDCAARPQRCALALYWCNANPRPSLQQTRAMAAQQDLRSVYLWIVDDTMTRIRPEFVQHGVDECAAGRRLHCALASGQRRSTLIPARTGTACRAGPCC